ncbi:MAG: hypothetical protein R6U96_11935 [Promethearchaeia archaeon]
MIKSTILRFIKSKNPDVIVQSPSRINLINPLDAVEGDYWMPSVAINGMNNPLSVFVYLKKIDEVSKIKIYDLKGINEEKITLKNEKKIPLKKLSDFKDKFSSEFKLVFASIYRLAKTNSLFWERFKNTNLEIGVITTIPRQSGLGGSASIIIALMFGLCKYFDILNNLSSIKEGEYPLNRDILAELATKVEDQDLGITAGYGDRYVICRGGLSFCSYYGKLHHKNIGKEPLAVYDKIDDLYNIEKLPIVICYSGVIHESGGVHKKLRSVYLSGDSVLKENYKKLAELSWKSRFVLMQKDWKTLGTFFRDNTRIMNNVMDHVGFKFGIGLANNILIKIIEEHPKVYAAKLTGAGGGGSVFALTEPSSVNEVKEYWKNRLQKIISNENLFKSKFPKYPIDIMEKLNNAKFFGIKIDKKGVKDLKTN